MCDVRLQAVVFFVRYLYMEIYLSFVQNNTVCRYIHYVIIKTRLSSHRNEESQNMNGKYNTLRQTDPPKYLVTYLPRLFKI
jgi:hypothetical protein